MLSWTLLTLVELNVIHKTTHLLRMDSIAVKECELGNNNTNPLALAFVHHGFPIARIETNHEFETDSNCIDCDLKMFYGVDIFWVHLLCLGNG